MKRSQPIVKKPWATVDPTTTNGSEKLQQLKESLREQRRRHATNGNKSNHIHCASSSQIQLPKRIITKCTTTESSNSTGSGSSTVSADGTINSNSQCSNSSSYVDATTVTTAQSTTIDSHESDSGSSSDTPQQPSSYSSRILHQLSGGISPLSCNTTTARTPTSNQAHGVHQQYLHLHKSIHVPNLEVQSPTGSTDSCDYTNTSPVNTLIDNDDDDESTTSSVKPPTLEEIYAAMGETLDRTTISPSPSLQENQCTVQLKAPPVENQALGDTVRASISTSPKRSTISTSFPSTPPPPNKRLQLNGVNPEIDSSVNTVKRSSYISTLYDSPIKTPSSTRRPQNGLRPFEQLLQHVNNGENNITNNNNIETTLLDVHQAKPTNFDETSLSDDVLDVISSTPTAISIKATSSATMSLSDSDDDECDYTTNSDTSGWASMGDSTAGPLGCSDSITDHVSVGSLGASAMMRQSITKTNSLHCTEVFHLPLDLTKTTSSSAKPATMSKRKNNIGKTKNTVTFQIESIEVNTSQSPARREQEKQVPKATVTQMLKPQSSIGTSTVHKPLFVTARRADEQCRTNGGHFSIALQSGMKSLQPSTGKPIRLARLKIAPTSPSLNVRLSTDLRCGTYGSLYDISMRSDGNGKCIVQHRSEGDAFGSDNPSTKKRERKTRTRVIRTTTTTRRMNVDSQRPDMLPIISQQLKKTETTAVSSGKGKLTSQEPVSSYIAVCGGIYDTTIQSGLTKDNLRFRTPYSLMLKPSTHR